MSSDVVRAAFRSQWATFAGDIPYVDVVNTPAEIPDMDSTTLFGTMLFSVEQRRFVTCGSLPWIEERGTVTIGVFARSADGDGDAIAAASDMLPLLTGRDLGNDVLVTEVTGPIDSSPEGEGEVYQVQLAAFYTWQGRQL